eukprot:1810444-Rhodomonas_salina.4
MPPNTRSFPLFEPTLSKTETAASRLSAGHVSDATPGSHNSPHASWVKNLVKTTPRSEKYPAKTSRESVASALPVTGKSVVSPPKRRSTFEAPPRMKLVDACPCLGPGSEHS